MKLDPVSLRLFVQIVERGSIAAAAASEHIAASAVSRRISDLEAVLQTSLLARTNKGVEPTAAGIALVNLSRGVLHELDEVQLQMRAYATGMRGRVRVMANISAITQFLPLAIKTFLAEHPQVQIQLQENISTAIAKAVVENVVDIGIFTMMPHGQQLEVLPFRDDELAVIAPKGHPLAKRRSVSFADTLGYDFVGLHAGSAINLRLLKSAEELGGTLRTAIEVSSYDALCLMVETGLGIGIMPRAAAQPYVKTLGIQVIRLAEPWAKRELKICVRSLDALPVAARLLVQHLMPR
ncbi:MAG: LysR substrate-binding domain-containing protein [Burkholderiaceae bacterium]